MPKIPRVRASSVFMAIGTVLLTAGFLFSVVYATRLFSNATTPITLHQVRADVTCAAMVTGDGAALSCWKEK